MKSQYTLERTTYGWLLCAAPGEVGIPVDALTEVAKLLPKTCVMDAGIGHHYDASCSQPRPKVISAIGLPIFLVQWREEIIDSLKDKPAPERWWRGVDVGKSSAALFAALIGNTSVWRWPAGKMGDKCVPADADDFGRCKRLLDLFPEWRARLPEVAAKYPDTKWPALIAQWSAIESANPELQTAMLRKL